MISLEPSDILEHKQGPIHDLVWNLILHYGIRYTPPPSVTKEVALLGLKRSFLTWINCVLDDIGVTNLSSDWRDGMVLTDLINYCSNGSKLDHSMLSPTNAYSNVHNAMNFAEMLGIPQLLEVDDIITEKPDEYSLLVYLSYFVPHGLNIFLKWVKSEIPDADLSNFSHDWIDGKLLGKLINALSGGKFDYKMDSFDGLAIVEKSMHAAEKILGIRRTVSAEQFANSSLDQIQRLSYLSQFYRVKVKGNAPVLIPPAADKVEVEEIQIPRTVGDGSCVWLEIDTADAGYGSVHAEVYGKEVGMIPVTVKAIEEELGESNRYQILFAPPKVDIYMLSVLYADVHVTGSPFLVNLFPPDPTKVKHIETLPPKESKTDLSMTFDTTDAGLGKLKANASGEIGGFVPIKVSLEANGSYILSFVPPLPDIYTIDVLWGKFSANAIGENSGPVALEVNHHNKRECQVSFKPPTADVYIVDINWDGKPVPGSPFTINLLPPSKPSAVECSHPIYTVPGEDVELLIDASDAGSGDLKVSCIGNEVGDVPVDVIDLGKRAYQVFFIPTEPDLYHLSVMYGSEHVRGSPFIIDMRPGVEPEFGEIAESFVPDATKCNLVSNSRVKDVVLINQPIVFTIDTKNAGPSQLEVEVDGPSIKDKPPMINVVQRPNEKGIYDVTFRPKVTGSYNINVFWSHQPVPETPLKVQALDYNSVERCHHGKPVGYDIDVDCKIGDLKVYAIHNESGALYKVKVTKGHKGKLKLIFSPREPGLYFVHASIKDNPITGSPFIVNYSIPPKSELCTIEGFNNKCYLDQPMEFLVITANAGTSDLVVKPTSPKHKKDSYDIQVVDNKDDTHSVIYTPHALGPQSLAITWGGKNIPGSPFTVTAERAEIQHTKNEKRELTKKEDHDSKWIEIEVGRTLRLKVRPHNDAQRNGTLNVKVHGEITGIGEVDVNQNEEGAFEIKFNPPEPDHYVIDVTLNGEKVPSSPFYVHYYAAAEKESTGLELDLSKEGPGKLTAVCIGDKCGEIPVQLVESTPGSRKYKLKIRPKEADYYRIYVKFNDKEIKNSPFIVDLRKSKKEIEEKKVPVDETFTVKEIEDREYSIPPTADEEREKVDPSKCKIIGKEDLSDVIKVGEEISLLVDARDAGPGQLKVTADKPSETTNQSLLTARLRSGETALYEVYYTPNSQGYHNLNFTWGDESIPDSPVNLLAVEKESVDLDFSKEGPGELTAVCIGDNCGEIPVQLLESTPGSRKYKLKIRPKEADYYRIYVKFNDKEIKNSPFIVDLRKSKKEIEEKKVPVDETFTVKEIIDGEYSMPSTAGREKADPSKCKIIGKEDLSDAIKVGEEISLLVDARDAGPGQLKVTADKPSETTNQSLLTARLRSGERALYEVYYTPNSQGYHNLNFTWGDESIPDSPVNLLAVEKESVDLDFSKEGPGELTAVCIGDNCGEIPVQLLESTPGSRKYKLKIRPKEADYYRIYVKFNDKEIKNSPFIVDLRKTKQEIGVSIPSTADEKREKVDPSKCKIIGKEDLSDVIKVGEEISLLVDARDAGPGQLKVTADKPLETTNQSFLTTHLRSGETALYEVYYTPNSQGYHNLNFTWGDESIPGSPVNLLAVEMERAQLYYHGKPVGVDFNSDIKHGDLKLKIIHVDRETDTLVKGKLTKVQKGKYKVTFSPKKPGLYIIHVLSRDKDIPSSPFFIRYGRPIKPEACKVVDLNESCFLGEEIKFTIDAKEAGDGELQVNTTGPDKKERLTASVEDNRDGTYAVTLLPDMPGEHKMSVLWSGKAIPSSPFSFKVRDLAAEQLITKLHLMDCMGTRNLIEFPTGDTVSTTTDKTLILSIKTRTNKQKNGNLEVTAIDPQTEERVFAKTVMEKDTFEVHFSPPSPGHYSISAWLNGEVVPNTPVQVMYVVPPPIASNCKIIGLEDHPPLFQVEKNILFQVDTRLAGDGKVSITAESPTGKPKLEARPSASENRIVDVTYTPNVPGTHKVKVLWSGEEIPDSPLSFEVEPVPVYPNGKPISYDLAVDASESELSSHVTHIQTGDHLKGKISKLAKHKYSFSFKPKVPGLYSLSIFAKKKEIKNSPIYIRYAAQPKPEAVVVRDLPDEAYVLEPFSFTVDATNSEVAKLDVKVTPPRKGKGGELTVTDNKNGTYTVKHVPQEVGTHSFKITWNRKNIIDSPVRVRVDRRVPSVKSSSWILH